MKKILITGGAGYIGSKLATKLVNEGHQVTVLDLMKYNKRLIYNFGHYRYGVLTAISSAKKVLDLIS